MTTLTTAVQDYSAVITWTSDWTKHLALNSGISIGGKTSDELIEELAALGSSALSIVSCVVDCADSRVTIDGGTAPTGSTKVVFRVSQTGIIRPTQVAPVVRVILSNGDSDERDFPIKFTNT